MGPLTRAHSCKRSALVTTTFSNSRGSRLRELRLYFLLTQMLMNAGMQEFVQQTPCVKTPMVAMTVNAVMDTQKVTMVTVRVSILRKIFFT